jgi:hypothetical protein
MLRVRAYEVIVTGEYEINDHSEHNHMKLSGDQIVSSKIRRGS